jgi:UMF1 family MFS transporter
MAGVATASGERGRWWDPRRWPAAIAELTAERRASVALGWALYDFANTIFSFAVVSYAINLWLTEETRFGIAGGQLALGLATAASMLLNAVVSPILGALSDRGGRRLPFLAFFTALCVVPTALIGGSPAAIGVLLFVLANFSYQAALIYYDATLATVGEPSRRGALSGLGVAVGYMGTLFIAVVLLVVQASVEATFLLAALGFAGFALPIFLVVKERPTWGQRLRPADLLASWSQLPTSLRHARQIPGLPRFLVARFFYTDAVNTVIAVMSAFAVRAVGMTEREALLVVLYATMVAVLASFGWGRLVDRVGPKRTLTIVLASWCVGLAIAGAVLSIPTVLVAAAILGSGLGGVAVTDRVFMLRLSPPDRVGEFFGLYGLAGKLSAVTGPLLYGTIVAVLFEPLGRGAFQVAILSLFLVMALGLWLLRPVDDRWRGPGISIDPALEPEVPPERLAPMFEPLEPRKEH